MKIYTTQKQVEADVKNGELYIVGDVTFRCDINMPVHIRVTGHIKAWNITACNISAGDIKAVNINARNITAGCVRAWNITAYSIKADRVSYYAFCNVYGDITCTEIVGCRNNHAKPVCLDGELTIKKKPGVKVKPTTKGKFKVGDKVRVKSGDKAGAIGVVVDVDVLSKLYVIAPTSYPLCILATEDDLELYPTPDLVGKLTERVEREGDESSLLITTIIVS